MIVEVVGKPCFSSRDFMEHEIVSNSPDETMALGRKIGFYLKGGEVVAFHGPLGSGKTHLIKGIIAGAGAEQPRHVTSPTFVIVSEYSAAERGLDIFHIDAYRLDSAEQLRQIGFDELCYPRSVVLVEWADKVQSILDGFNCIWIKLSHQGPQIRRIHFENLPSHIADAIV
jgi:tRNA threonylcarbamoyladenosine biosynthesis protein TsaE